MYTLRRISALKGVYTWRRMGLGGTGRGISKTHSDVLNKEVVTVEL